MAAIKIVKTHERVYTKIDYWRKEAVIAKHDFFGQPNDNQPAYAHQKPTDVSLTIWERPALRFAKAYLTSFISPSLSFAALTHIMALVPGEF